MATLDERQQKISSGLKYAEEMQAKLAATQQESAALIKSANVEAARIIEEARKSAKEFLDKQTQEATAKANDLLTKAQQAIELEHKKMLADARTEIARLVVTTTERVLAKKLSDADRAAYNDAASRELTTV
jgi:F-type H+-transporting ATPase subunit b